MHVLKLVTMPAAAAKPCRGDYLCDCDPCIYERAQLVEVGVRAEKRQPWQPEQRAA